MRHRARTVVIILVSLLCSACQTWDFRQGWDAGATGLSYVKHHLSKRYAVPLPQVRKAAIEAMDDMGMDSVKEKEITDGILFEGKAYDYRRVHVRLRAGEGCTTVNVHIGLADDEPFARVLFDRISLRLATQPRLPEQPGLFTNLPRDLAPDSMSHMGQDVSGYRGMPLR
jgi:hypothetical protein